jgi:hypothetical protein
MLFTFQVIIVLVPPAVEAKKRVVVTTFTEIVAGEMVTLMPVTGSVQATEDEAVEVVAAVVVQVTAALVAVVLLQEAIPNAAATNAKKKMRFTAPLCSSAEASIAGILDSCTSISTRFSKRRSQILILLMAKPLGERELRIARPSECLSLELLVQRANRGPAGICAHHKKLRWAHEIQHEILNRSRGIQDQGCTAAGGYTA